MRSNTVFTLLFAVVVVAVLIGEAYVYTVDDGRCSSGVSVTAGGIEYSVTSVGSDQYSVIVMDNGSFEKIDSYYIYCDERYGSKVEKVPVPVGAKEFTQEYYISQLVKTLNNRGIHDIEILNADELKDAMDADISASKASVKGLIVLSGALPETIYTGVSGDTIIDWIGNGGSLYWAGNVLGKYYGTSDGKVTEVAATVYGPLFNIDPVCISDSDETVLSDINSNEFRYSLSLMNNRIKYGIDPSGLSVDFLSVGYTKDGYCSAVLYSYGNGMICVLAGDYSSNHRHDLVQLVASGICYDTAQAGYADGEVKRGTVSGTIDVSFVSGNNYAAYVYCGGYYTVYGKAEGWSA